MMQSERRECRECGAQVYDESCAYCDDCLDEMDEDDSELQND